ncbi:MAG: hypothetical protein KDC38_07525, partial [Planctomycetes bacterium]|nr:hypothetical protein [Planctomycetota bacterium]
MSTVTPRPLVDRAHPLDSNSEARDTMRNPALWITLLSLVLIVPRLHAQSAEPASSGPPPISIGDIISGSVDAAEPRDDYSFSAPPGTVLYLDALSASAANAVNWKLCDEQGRVLRKNFVVFADLPAVTLMGGQYTVTVISESGGASTYEFQLVDAAPSTSALSIGTPIIGDLTAAGGRHDYTFEVLSPRRLFVDAISASSLGNLRFELTDEWGRVLASTPTSLADFGPIGVLPGPHTLSVISDAGGTSDYEFQVLDVSDDFGATSIGSTISGEIAHPGQVDHYAFSAAPGTEIAFVLQTSSASSALDYVLEDTFGRVIFGPTTSLNSTEGIALLGGDYVLSIVGEGSSTGTYTFDLISIGDDTGTLVLDAPFSGSIDTTDEEDHYGFTLASDQKIYLDVIATSNQAGLNWVIRDTTGRELVRTNSLADAGPYTLGAGDYTLTIDGETSATGTYDLQIVSVVDVATTTSIGAMTSTALATGQTLEYEFTASPGQVVTLDAVSPASSAFVDWKLTDQFGRVV